MDPLADITLTGDLVKRHASLQKLTRHFEFSQVREEAMEISMGDAFISLLLAERQMPYQEERRQGHKQGNQDAILISQPGEMWHAGVADGVGGLPMGDVAATQALRFIHHYFQQYLFPDLFKHAALADVRDAIEGLLRRASRHLNHLDRAGTAARLLLPGRSGATTVVGAFPLNHRQIIIYSVGDSGVVLIPRQPNRPILYTQSHTTFEQALGDDPSSRPDGRRQALHADFFTNTEGRECRDLLVAALGGGERKPRQLFVGVAEVLPGDTLLLYTDGLLKTVGKTSDYAPADSQDLRLVEYGRADRLLEHLSDPSRSLKLLLDKTFRMRHGGPELLLDDTALVRINIDPLHAKPLTHNSRAERPRAQIFPELPVKAKV